MTGNTFYLGDLKEEFRGDQVALIYSGRGFIRTALNGGRVANAMKLTEDEPLKGAYFGINMRGCEVINNYSQVSELRKLDKMLLNDGALQVDLPKP